MRSSAATRSSSGSLDPGRRFWKDAGRRSSASSALRASGKAGFWRSSRATSARTPMCTGGDAYRTAKASPTGRSRRSSSRQPGSSRATTATRSSGSWTASSTLPTHDLDALRTIAAALSNVIGIPMTPRGTYAAGEIAQGRAALGTAKRGSAPRRPPPDRLRVRGPALGGADTDRAAQLPGCIERRHASARDLDGSAGILQADPGFANGAGSRRQELDVLPRGAGKRLLTELIGTPRWRSPRSPRR